GSSQHLLELLNSRHSDQYLVVSDQADRIRTLHITYIDMGQVARSQVQIGIQAVSYDQHLLQIQFLELAYQSLGLGGFNCEALNHDQTIQTHQLGQDRAQCATIHLPVQLLLMVPWTSCKSGTAPTPDWAADSTGTS